MTTKNVATSPVMVKVIIDPLNGFYCRDCRRLHSEPFMHTTAMPIYCTAHRTYHQAPVCDPKPPFCARCGESVFGVMNHECRWVDSLRYGLVAEAQPPQPGKARGSFGGR